MTTRQAHALTQAADLSNRRADVLKRMVMVIEGADRIGPDRDEPEGVRFIQISDTLALQLVRTMREVQ